MPKPTTRRIRDAIDARADRRFPPGKLAVSAGTVHAGHLHNEAFCLIGAHPRMIEPIEQIFGEKVYMHQYKINAKSAFTGDVWQWHQDYAHGNAMTACSTAIRCMAPPATSRPIRARSYISRSTRSRTTSARRRGRTSSPIATSRQSKPCRTTR
ncbi:MAG: phytanoyl-CoA dioxygenase family protein [Afipia sp.]|nr:phytanoyl-CoA dioxygenase family protein [Afipia sp.]